ncbi:MAG: T9SS type A sorting domain-containing protein [candidate division Zixibacteria bacterium]|nr:T9SS type A sorting domain-containing protein [candidate division Zixibacteria bacterium]
MYVRSVFLTVFLCVGIVSLAGANPIPDTTGGFIVGYAYLEDGRESPVRVDFAYQSNSFPHQDSSIYTITDDSGYFEFYFTWTEAPTDFLLKYSCRGYLSETRYSDFVPVWYNGEYWRMDFSTVTLECDDRMLIGDERLRIGNDPNPFNPTTSIEFILPAQANVKLEIYDIMGRMVATLADGAYGAGEHSVVWDASDYSSGVYFYRLEAGDEVVTKRMTLLK